VKKLKPVLAMAPEHKYLKEDQIPDLIRQSPYLQSILENGPFPPDGLRVPKRCLKTDEAISSEIDLMEYLHTVRYWMLPDETVTHSYQCIRFCLYRADRSLFCEILEEFATTIPCLRSLWNISQAPASQKIICAAESGALGVLKYFFESGECAVHSPYLSNRGAYEAASAGHLDCLAYLHKHGACIRYVDAANVAFFGHTNCLRYLRENKTQWPSQVLVEAGKGGHLDCLKYAFEQRDSDERILHTFQHVALCCHLDCLKYLLDQVPTTAPYEADILLCGAQGGNIEVLKLSMERKFRLPSLKLYSEIGAHSLLEVHVHFRSPSGSVRDAHCGRERKPADHALPARTGMPT